MAARDPLRRADGARARAATAQSSPPPPPTETRWRRLAPERCRALDSAVGAAGTRVRLRRRGEEGRRVDAASALMELLGFGDKALALMGELCEKKAAVAAVDVRDIGHRDGVRRRGLCGNQPVSYGDARNLISTQCRTTSSKSSLEPPCAAPEAVPAAPKQLRKQRREAEAKGIDEGADYLAALGFDEPPA